MLRVIGCITQQHDLGLVLLAACLCLFACATAMSMIVRTRISVGRERLFWLGAAGMVAGCGIWATHFVAMLAFNPGFPVGYDQGFTALSIVIAVLLCSAGFALSLRNGFAPVGGALTGAAISAMHYVGMAALRTPATAVWDHTYIVASVLIGVGLTAAAMQVLLNSRTTLGYVQGSLLFTLAICGMHFTGMTAVTFIPNPEIALPAAGCGCGGIPAPWSHQQVELLLAVSPRCRERDRPPPWLKPDRARQSLDGGRRHRLRESCRARPAG